MRKWSLPSLAGLTWPQVQKPATFLVGLLGVLHETFWTQKDRPDLLILFAGMMGVPFFQRRDEKAQSGKMTPPTPDQPSAPTREASSSDRETS